MLECLDAYPVFVCLLSVFWCLIGVFWCLFSADEGFFRLFDAWLDDWIVAVFWCVQSSVGDYVSSACLGVRMRLMGVVYHERILNFGGQLLRNGIRCHDCEIFFMLFLCFL